MKGFIEITDKDKHKRLLNIKHIEEVAEKDEESCYIYLDVYDDYFEVNEPYDTIKYRIKKAVIQNDTV